MNRFTLEQRWEILQNYFQSDCCVAQTVRNLKRSFGPKEAPSEAGVRKFIKKVRETGMLVDKNYAHARPVRTDEIIAAVAQSVRVNPKLSTRHRAQQLNISRSSLRRILDKELGFVHKVGDKVPSVDLFEDSPANKINLSDLCTNKRVILFGVPGAFTPECSKTDLPRYIKDSGTLKDKENIDEIVCVSVNDPFVMSAWGKSHGANGKVRMLADPHGKLAEALQLAINLPPLGGVRSKRFSMLVENCEIMEYNVEPDGTELDG